MLYLILSLFILFTVQLSSATNYYYKVSYHNIQCFAPPCSNYLVEKVNIANSVSIPIVNFVFPNGVEQNFLTLEEANSVVVYGSLTANRDGYNINDFNVVRAYKRLSQSNAASSTDKYYMFADNGVRCITTPCFSTNSIQLNTGSINTVHTISQPYSNNVNLFDSNWLSARTFDDETHRIIGFGSIDSTGLMVLSSAYVRLPDPKTNCPALPLLKCQDSFTTVYERDSNRCLVNPTCTTQSGACALYIPTCPLGYRLVSYPGGNFGCPVYFCDSDYITETY